MRALVARSQLRRQLLQQHCPARRQVTLGIIRRSLLSAQKSLPKQAGCRSFSSEPNAQPPGHHASHLTSTKIDRNSGIAGAKTTDDSGGAAGGTGAKGAGVGSKIRNGGKKAWEAIKKRPLVFIYSLLLLSFFSRRTGTPLPAEYYLEIDFSKPIEDLPPGLLDFMGAQASGGGRIMDMLWLIRAIRMAALDPHVMGIVGRFGDQEGAVQTGNLGRVQEVRDALLGFRAVSEQLGLDKFTVAYADSFSQGGQGLAEYYLASGFEHVYLQRSGYLGIAGVGTVQPFMRGLLERLGVKLDFVRREEYKTFANNLVKDGFDEPHREATESLLQSLLCSTSAGIIQARRLFQPARDAAADQGDAPAKQKPGAAAFMQRARFPDGWDRALTAAVDSDIVIYGNPVDPRLGASSAPSDVTAKQIAELKAIMDEAPLRPDEALSKGLIDGIKYRSEVLDVVDQLAEKWITTQSSRHPALLFSPGMTVVPGIPKGPPATPGTGSSEGGSVPADPRSLAVAGVQRARGEDPGDAKEALRCKLLVKNPKRKPGKRTSRHKAVAVPIQRYIMSIKQREASRRSLLRRPKDVISKEGTAAASPDALDSTISAWDSRPEEKLVALITGVGTIQRSVRTPGLSSAVDIFSRKMCRDLERARDDPNVKAVVLRVNSGGGDALASDSIARAIEEVRLAGKPVVCSMANVAASGGYMMAAACDKILAHPATITGSIGVFGMKPSIRGMLQKIGVTTDEVEINRNATEMSLLKEFTPEQRKRLERVIDIMYQDFLAHVAKGRGMTKEQVREVAKGRVWTGEQAVQLGLVDQLGGVRDARRLALELANLDERDPTVSMVPYPEPLSTRDIMWAVFTRQPPQGMDQAQVQAIRKALWAVPAAIQLLASGRTVEDIAEAARFVSEASALSQGNVPETLMQMSGVQAKADLPV